MNNNSNAHAYHQPYAGASGGINPAVLAAFQNQNANKPKYPPGGGGAVNPAQLMNGMGMGMGGGMSGGMGMQQHTNNPMSINPAQLLQQQQLMNGMGMAGSNTNNNMTGSINPAALSSSNSNPNPASHPPQSPASGGAGPGQNLSTLLGLTPDQFNALPTFEKQQKMMVAASQQHQATIREQFREKQLLQQQQAQAQQLHGMLGSGGGMAPQAQQQQFRDSMQQQQLRDRMGGMGMNMNAMNMGGMNMGAMGGSGGGGGGGGGSSQQQFREQILQGYQQQQHPSQQQQQQHMASNMGMGMNLGSMGGMSMGSSTGMGMGVGGMYSNQQPQTQGTPQPHQTQHQQQQQNMNQDLLQGLMGGPGRASSAMGSFYDRPLSSAGSASGAPPQQQQPQQGQVQGGMMLPPSIPRGPGGMSAGMGMGMNMGTGMRNVPGGAGGVGAMRPPSRAMSATPVNTNGANVNGRGMSPSQNQQQQQGQGMGANPYPQNQHQQQQPFVGQGQQVFAHSSPGHHSQQQQPMTPQTLRSTPTPAPGPNSASPPLPGSPYRGAKRKVTADAGSPLGMGPGMGPPAPANGYQPQPSPTPTPTHGHGHRPPSSMGMGMNGAGGGGGDIPRPPTQPPQQQQQQQRQSVSRQGSVPIVAKAGSVPPTAVPAQAEAKANTTPASITASASTPTSAPALAVSTTPASTSTAATAPTSTTTTAPPPPAPQPQVIPHLPPLPANVSLNPAVTRVTVVPLLTSLSTIPALSSPEIEDVKGWMEVDKAYEGSFRSMKERMGAEARVALHRADWWEKGGGSEGGNVNRWRRPREGFDVRYPRSRKAGEGRGRRGIRREGLRLPRKLDLRDVNRPEQLVPIRLEFDVEHHKMRDTFVWNLNDPVVTPENFAQTVVEDYNLSASYHAVITKAIQDQLSDFKAHTGQNDGEGGDPPSPVFSTSVGADVEDPGPKRGRLDGEEETWWTGWRERVHKVERERSRSRRRGKKRRKVVVDVKEEGEDGIDGDVEDGLDEIGTGKEDWDKSVGLEEMEINEATMHEEMRILIKLDIIVGSMKLDDQFEWDLENENASPEEFAGVYAQELGLNGEFTTAIAHSIREQVQTYQKSLYLVGHPSDGSAIQDDDLRFSFLPSLTSAARPLDQIQSYTPLLNYLSDGEIERTEKDRDKDMNKRRKRNTRGRRGIALPDREPIRTYRTPAIGFPELDPATLALAVAANAPMSRRAAAAAATLTIANMVASENGTAFLPQVAVPSTAVPPPAPKDKKTAKGHFKAPPYPPTVLRPRAHVTAPTSSTAADVSKLPAPLENDPPPPVVSSSVVIGTAQPPDSKVAKVITAKRAKELEREAREKEFADGQHPNMIDGVWHCSNCGCPDSIAIGRRKGPLGDKSQCGLCGRYWHRHRRPRPVEYNPDPDFHNGIKRELEVAKVTASAKKKGGAAALRAQSSTLPHTPAETSEAQTPARSNGDVDVSARQSPIPTIAPSEDDRAISPVSTASSASEPPLAQRIKLNGSNSYSRRASTPPAPGTPAAAPTSTAKGDGSPIKNTPASKDTKMADAATVSPTSPARPLAVPPQWLSSAKAAMMARYPNDKFEIILRKVSATSSPEWRIKCLDCPGKLYTPGPGETLANYEVHLKNRQHRQRVNDRINNGADS
ncbi:hypothetical protein D9615_003252 [Tricholomella constricta]|uniref:SNF5-domain-containing protein n=1 Tax=Tricholomella constricta TaxID=117010 RepID=A0A8H5HJ60_9AGAR|nr:hypothetical protein D9615_003252 [Tricholomella constricta]